MKTYFDAEFSSRQAAELAVVEAEYRRRAPMPPSEKFLHASSARRGYDRSTALGEPDDIQSILRGVYGTEEDLFEKSAIARKCLGVYAIQMSILAGTLRPKRCIKDQEDAWQAQSGEEATIVAWCRWLANLHYEMFTHLVVDGVFKPPLREDAPEQVLWREYLLGNSW